MCELTNIQEIISSKLTTCGGSGLIVMERIKVSGGNKNFRSLGGISHPPTKENQDLLN